MKHTVKILALIMVIAMALAMITACEQLPPAIQDIINQIQGVTTTPDDPDSPVDPVDPVDPSSTFTVKWVQGQKVLKEETLSAGSTLTSWTPSISGKEFLGWFSDPGLTKAFDFENTTVTADMKVYASFKTTGAVDPVEPDLAEFFLIGEGLGDLKDSAWNHGNSAKNLGMTDKGNGTFEIIVKMYAGDRFQVGTGGSWSDGQWGIGCMTGNELVDEKNAQVKNSDGDVVFTGNSGAYNNPVEKMDITLAEGQDGVYKFTFDSATYTITWQLVEKIDPFDDSDIPVNPDLGYYVVGTFLNDGGEQVNFNIVKGVSPKMELQEDGTYAIVIDVTDVTESYDWLVNEGQVAADGNPAIFAIKVVYGEPDNIRTWFSGETTDNVYLSAAGKYRITLRDGHCYAEAVNTSVGALVR